MVALDSTWRMAWQARKELWQRQDEGVTNLGSGSQLSLRKLRVLSVDTILLALGSPCDFRDENTCPFDSGKVLAATRCWPNSPVMTVPGDSRRPFQL